MQQVCIIFLACYTYSEIVFTINGFYSYSTLKESAVYLLKWPKVLTYSFFSVKAIQRHIHISILITSSWQGSELSCAIVDWSVIAALAERAKLRRTVSPYKHKNYITAWNLWIMYYVNFKWINVWRILIIVSLYKYLFYWLYQAGSRTIYQPGSLKHLAIFLFIFFSVFVYVNYRLIF